MNPERSSTNEYPERCGVIWVRGRLGNFKLRTIQDLHDYIEAVKGTPPKALGARQYERKITTAGLKVAPHLTPGHCLCGLDIEKVCKGYDLNPPSHYKHKGAQVSYHGSDRIAHYNFVYRFDEDESGKKLLTRRSLKGLHFLPLPRKLHLHEDLQDHPSRSALEVRRQSRRRKARCSV